MIRPFLFPQHPGTWLRAGRPFIAGFTLLAVLALCGCGGTGVADVNGKVYYKGKVVTSGFVTMVGPDGHPKNSAIQEDGSYEVKGVGAGEVRVAVASPPLDPAKIKKAPGRTDPNTGKKIENPDEAKIDASDLQKKTWREIPREHSDIVNPKLKITVVSGPNTQDIKLD